MAGSRFDAASRWNVAGPNLPDVPMGLLRGRAEVEREYPALMRFRDVAVAPALVPNKGGLGEYVEPDDPTNPVPGRYTITIGENVADRPGGVASTIAADMVHAATDSPEFGNLKSRMLEGLSQNEIDFARRRYEKDFAGKYSGTNFETFDNFLSNYWLDGILQHQLIPHGSEIDEIRKGSPDLAPVLDDAEKWFRTPPSPDSGRSRYEQNYQRWLSRTGGM